MFLIPLLSGVGGFNDFFLDFFFFIVFLMGHLSFPFFSCTISIQSWEIQIRHIDLVLYSLSFL